MPADLRRITAAIEAGNRKIAALAREVKRLREATGGEDPTPALDALADSQEKAVLAADETTGTPIVT